LKCDTWTCTTAMRIDDVRTTGNSYRVIVHETGKVAYLPIRWTEIRPGHAIIPVELKLKITGQPPA